MGRTGSFMQVILRVYILQAEKRGNKILTHPLHIVGTPKMLTGSSNAGRASVVSEDLLFGSFELRNSSKPLLKKKICPKN